MKSCLRKGTATRVAGTRFQWPRTGPKRYLVPQGELELVIRESSIISIVLGKSSTRVLPWQFPQGRNEDKNPSCARKGWSVRTCPRTPIMSPLKLKY